MHASAWFKHASKLRRWLGASLLCALACGAAADPDGIARTLAALEQRGRAKPEATLAEVDSLLASLPPGSAERLPALRLAGWLAANVRDAERVERTATAIEALGAPVDRLQARAAAAFVRAQLLRNGGPYGRADRLLGDAIARLPDATPADARVRYLGLLADIKDHTGKPDDAVRLYQEALALADGTAPAWQRSELRSSLAYTLSQVGQAERALAINREATALAERDGDHVALFQAATTEAIALSGRDDPAGELRALQAAVDHARAAGSRRDEVLALANLADSYLKRGQYATALRRSQQALPLARELKNQTAESTALINGGLALVSMHRKDEGLASARAGMAIEERAGSIGTLAASYGELGAYLEKAGYAGDALAAYREHRKLVDEVFQRERQQAILELQEGFDNERRDRELALLNRENRIKEAQLLHRDLQQRLGAAAAAAGALLLALVLLLLRRMRDNNAALATSNEKLRLQSERDPLTGLANRRHFQTAVQSRDADARFDGTLLLIDVDHFKRINDGHGHAAGDAVLVEIAQRVRAAVRGDDLVVRWGGEEFLVVAHALAAEPVEALAARLLAAVAGLPVGVGDARVGVSVSIGFATFPLQPTRLAVNWEQAIRLVDSALYLAKAHGRNRAFGVQALAVRDIAELEAAARDLDAAMRDGRAALVPLQGPPPLGATP